MAQFNFSFQPGMTLPQMLSFELAGRIWGAYLTDNVTINLHVGATNDLPDRAIGGALPAFKYQQSYGEFSNALTQDATSNDDRVVAAARAGNSTPIIRQNYRQIGAMTSVTQQSASVSTLSLTTANAKALNLPPGHNGIDGLLVFRPSPTSTLNWSYDFLRSGVIPSNTVDLISTAMHEIGHVLGMVSGVDRPLFTSSSISTIMRSSYLTTLDLVRFDPGFAGTLPNLSYGGSRVFGLTSADDALASFSTGQRADLGGNGFQASHWSGEGSSSGLMNPTIRAGQQSSIAPLDLRALDVIGWNIAANRINTPPNFSTLLSQAKETLAGRIGRTVTWLDNSANASTAASLLSTDRSSEIMDMVDLSGVYAGRTNQNTRSWQGIASIVNEQGLMEQTEQEPVKATLQDDILPGSTFEDDLSGLRGHDQVIGFTGNDILRGSRGHDTLIGGEGDDYLIGGRGDDSLVGGAGADRFAVQVAMGLDTVEDFTLGEDKLVLPNGVQWQQLSLEQQGQHTAIGMNGTPLMLLQNVNANLLTATDILTTL